MGEDDEIDTNKPVPEEEIDMLKLGNRMKLAILLQLAIIFILIDKRENKINRLSKRKKEKVM